MCVYVNASACSWCSHSDFCLVLVQLNFCVVITYRLYAETKFVCVWCIQIYIQAVVRLHLLSPEVNISRRQMTACCWVTCRGRLRGPRRTQLQLLRQPLRRTTATPPPPSLQPAHPHPLPPSLHPSVTWEWVTPRRRLGASAHLWRLEEATLIGVWRHWDVIWTIHHFTLHRQPAGSDPAVTTCTLSPLLVRTLRGRVKCR